MRRARLTLADEMLVSEEADELILVSEGNLFAVDPERERVRQLTRDRASSPVPSLPSRGAPSSICRSSRGMPPSIACARWIRICCSAIQVLN